MERTSQIEFCFLVLIARSVIFLNKHHSLDSVHISKFSLLCLVKSLIVIINLKDLIMSVDTFPRHRSQQHCNARL